MQPILTTMLVAGMTVMMINVAYAQQDPADFTPEGYEFCGWRDFIDRTWSYDYPGRGAFQRLFASGMSCRAARRNFLRLRYRPPSYRPFRRGYRCRVLDKGIEYTDTRCVRKGGKRKFRFQAGA